MLRLQLRGAVRCCTDLAVMCLQAQLTLMLVTLLTSQRLTSLLKALAPLNMLWDTPASSNTQAVTQTLRGH